MIKVLAIMTLQSAGYTVAASEAPCSSWLESGARGQIMLVSADVNSTVGSPETSELSKCVWDKLETIANQATENCKTSDSNYEVAVLRAVSGQVRSCITTK